MNETENAKTVFSEQRRSTSTTTSSLPTESQFSF